MECYGSFSNSSEILRQLNVIYGTAKRQVLRFQSATTGLFPSFSNEDREGNVRDSVYCAAAVWSLYLAYRRIDDDQGKSYELGQSAVKCMRGILECWIKQGDKIELFKKKQCNSYALHCKFDLNTGDEIYSEHSPNLQIYVVSIFLLYLVNMTKSGLQIIYTQDEVAFVQNLVYYVERAYRTPDFGIWERGTKYNNGTPEIHASSIGMAKSALEAINGCNLFGDEGASWSVIYVDIDAHNRNRSIFDAMLPRESSSKEVDIALLTTISFPAFATQEKLNSVKTEENILKLKGRYGFKRYPCDGYKTVIEDKKRQFYVEGETKGFENIECEWPIFFIFMIIDGIFKNLPDQVEEYTRLLNALVETDNYGDSIIPMYFYVSAADLEMERQNPGTVKRLPSEMGSLGGGLFLWAQAVYIISQLLTKGLLHVNQLDPIKRHQSSHNRPHKSGRYSAFQGTPTDLVVQIALIAESMRLQAMMATYGIQTQTPHQIEPVQIWSSSQLVQVYEYLGVNTKLNLKGRPSRPIGALGTSKVYRICGTTVLCYPLVFEVSEFYLYRDMALLIDDIKTELQFVGRNWRLSGRPTVCLIVKEDHMRDPHFKEMLSLLAMLKKGNCDGVKVRIGRLQNLISSSCMEHLDFINVFEPPETFVTSFKQLEHDYVGYQSLTDVSRAVSYPEVTLDESKNYEAMPLEDVIEVFKNTTELRLLCKLLQILLQREGKSYKINEISVEDHIKALYSTAGSRRCWDVVRCCSSLLKHTVDSISPFITTVLVNGKQLTVGVIGHEETVFDKPMIPAEIHSVMYTRVQPYDLISAVLQQEVVLYCGRLMATDPQVFKGIIKIRVGWMLEAIKIYLSIKQIDCRLLESKSPFEVRQLIYKVLSAREWASNESLSIFQRRQIEGCLCRVPSGFYDQVWDVLCRSPFGINVGSHHLPQKQILSNMTRSELSFALLVEETINHIIQPEFRQIVVELLSILSTILARNPELNFQKKLDLDELIDSAMTSFIKDNKSSSKNDFFSTPYSVTTSYLARAVVNNLLQGCTLLSNIGPLNENYCSLS